ncbi:MAG: type VI secretion system baseplate subunit TssG [Alphaproteobacteria bacterium]|nr:type VI secretion system baseplate subunit TssG [Alphaproteobacteria bacterium]
MARSHRKSALTVKDILLKEPYRFEFHQAIKLLEYLRPKAVPFGETADPNEEVVSVKARIYLEALSSDIYSLESTEGEEQPYTLSVNFMGIAGIQGPLPFPYTEMMIQRIRNGDTSLKDFLDIFNHRLASILHRIKKQYLISLNTHSPEKTDIAIGLRSFIGINEKALRDRMYVPDRSLLDYAGLFWSRPHSASGLESILKNYFRIPLRVEKCAGAWRPIQKEQQTRIGQTGQWQVLGQGAALGTRAWDQENHFCLHLGPLTLEQLDLFIPAGKAYKRLCDLTRFYSGPLMDFTIVYDVEQPPSTKLEGLGYLGWRSWLGSSLIKGDPVKLPGVEKFDRPIFVG